MKKSLLLPLVCLLVLFSLQLFYKEPAKQPVTPTEKKVQGIATQSAKVTKVVDGDTIKLESGQTVRLIGIDTPETVDPRRGVQCFGKEASDKTKELLVGALITLEKDVSETDKYGRLLRYVYKDGVMINKLLVEQGYAHASSYPPDVKYQDQLKTAEQEARKAGRGLWSDCESSSNTTPTSLTTPTILTSPTVLTCDCSKSCANISSCQEAQFQLKECGCTARDGDNDSIACSGSPLNCK